MKINLKFIKFFSIASVVVFIACYITSLIHLKNTWISSEFLFTIFSGIFASFIVVLITEINKYFVNKRMAEDAIYGNCVGLYVELTSQMKRLDMFLKAKNELIPNGTLEHRMPSLAGYNNQLRFIDYTTARKQGVLFKRFWGFVQEENPKIEKHIGICSNLQIAINQTKINHLKNGILSYNPTVEDPLVKTAVQKIKASAEARRVAVDGFLQTMVSVYPNRFNWSNEKAAIDSIHFDIQEINKNSDEFFEC